MARTTTYNLDAHAGGDEIFVGTAKGGGGAAQKAKAVLRNNDDYGRVVVREPVGMSEIVYGEAVRTENGVEWRRDK